MDGFNSLRTIIKLLYPEVKINTLYNIDAFCHGGAALNVKRLEFLVNLLMCFIILTENYVLYSLLRNSNFCVKIQ